MAAAAPCRHLGDGREMQPTVVRNMCIAAAAAGRHLSGWYPGREAWIQLLAAGQDIVQPAVGLAHCCGAGSLSGGHVSAGCFHAARCVPIWLPASLIPARPMDKAIECHNCCLPVASLWQAWSSMLLDWLVVMALAAGVMPACSPQPASVATVSSPVSNSWVLTALPVPIVLVPPAAALGLIHAGCR